MILVVHQLTPDPPGKMKILAHDCDSTGVESTEVNVLEKSYKVGLRGLLKGEESRGLEAEFGVVLPGELTDESLEGKSLHESVGALLEAPNVSKSDCSWSPPNFTGNTTFGRGRLAAALGGSSFL